MMSQLMEGVVVDTSDPQQMGRIKVWVPAIDGTPYDIVNLPWATYLSPMAGQTRDYPAGPDGTITEGFVSYGWFSVPKSGALVVVGFLYGDANKRIYMGSYFRDHGNRSLPAGRNRPDLSAVPISDTFDDIQPQADNLNAQFRNMLSTSEARTRGAYERAVAQDKTEKDGTEGYQIDAVLPKDDIGNQRLESQTHTFTTPGRHSIIFQDNAANCRIRIKSAAGHQLILDDANERIYLSTARGNTWIEMDQDGRLHVYAADSISVATGGDFNLSASGSFNVRAGKDVNIQAGASTRIAACTDMNISGNGVNLQSFGSFNILSAGALLQSGSTIHLNGPKAASAACPTAAKDVPSHEPWTRPASKGKRNKNYKA